MAARDEVDFKLVEQIKQGNTACFNRLVERYQDITYSLAYSILKDSHDAEDAAQESFIKAYKALPKFKFKSSFYTWFYRIVLNVCRSRLKRAGALKTLQLNAEYEEYYADDDDEIAAEYNKLSVNECIDLLKPPEALMLRLFYLASLSIKEIEEVTGFKSSKIRVTLHRARQNFKSVYLKHKQD